MAVVLSGLSGGKNGRSKLFDASNVSRQDALEDALEDYYEMSGSLQELSGNEP